jgi:hypothetical protein
MRNQIIRQLKEMKALQKADIPTRFAEKLFKRMLTETDGLCVERDRELKSAAQTSIKLSGLLLRGTRGSGL